MSTTIKILDERLAETMPKHVFPVERYDVYDGDTIKTVLDLSFYVHTDASCRVAGVDTPERNTDAGRLVALAVLDWFLAIPRKDLRCISLDRDKFGGRFLGTFFECGKAQTLTHWLLSHGIARPYEGGKKPEWTQLELREVERRARGLITPQSTAEVAVFDPDTDPDEESDD